MDSLRKALSIQHTENDIQGRLISRGYFDQAIEIAKSKVKASEDSKDISSKKYAQELLELAALYRVKKEAFQIQAALKMRQQNDDIASLIKNTQIDKAELLAESTLRDWQSQPIKDTVNIQRRASL